MKTALLDLLICPCCLPGENPLRLTATRSFEDDAIEGALTCGTCGSRFPIRDGIAFLDPSRAWEEPGTNRYETPTVLSSYLWSHYGDLLEEENATDAYARWAGLMRPSSGACLDAGCAVGRFSFEMAQAFEFVVGVDNAVSFVRASRELMVQRSIELHLIEEGLLTRRETLRLPGDWKTDNLEFIVADALALPFRSGAFSALSSLNLADKVPKPLRHLAEMNRLAERSRAQLLFSDPFSWSADVAEEGDWLGGTDRGRFAGRGKDNVRAILEGKTGNLEPPWTIDRTGEQWWKIRTHSNHFEWIRSCWIKAFR